MCIQIRKEYFTISLLLHFIQNVFLFLKIIFLQRINYVYCFKYFVNKYSVLILKIAFVSLNHLQFLYYFILLLYYYTFYHSGFLSHILLKRYK